MNIEAKVTELKGAGNTSVVIIQKDGYCEVSLVNRFGCPESYLLSPPTQQPSKPILEWNT